MHRPHPRSSSTDTLCPYKTLFRSRGLAGPGLQPERLGASYEAGGGGGGQAAGSQGKGSGQPGRSSMVVPRELAQRIERADKGRVFVRYRRISYCGGQASAPLVLVGVAKGGAPIIPSVEKIDVARDGRATGDFQTTAPRK